jgi:addiction module HigA family antidote
MMTMFNPPHPGETLLEDVLPALDVSITDLAKRLSYSRETMSRIVHGHAPISPDLAVRLERAGIGTARVWLEAQASYDLWHAERREQPHIERFAVITHL